MSEPTQELQHSKTLDRQRSISVVQMEDALDNELHSGTKDAESSILQPRNVASSPLEVSANHFDNIRQAFWSPDGTCILVQRPRTVATYILPETLLSSDEKLTLLPRTSHFYAEAIQSLVPYPFFQSAEPRSALAAVSLKDHPLKLVNVLFSDLNTQASYPLINPETEAFIAPTALTFSQDGTRLIAGGSNLLASFDITRDGQGPQEMRWTHNKQKNIVTHRGYGMKGTISTLAINPNGNGILAAGTTSGLVGLYEFDGSRIGQCVSLFSTSSELGLGGTERYTDDNVSDYIVGTGISQVIWSPCGRYLIVAERKSDGILIFDTQFSRKLAWLRGRNAVTQQRLFVSVVPMQQGWEIWAGGTDGKVRVWRDPHLAEGEVWPTTVWDGHSYPVVSTLVHGSGTVAATCCAPDYSLSIPDVEDGTSSEDDSEDETGSSEVSSVGAVDDSEMSIKSDRTSVASSNSTDKQSTGMLLDSTLKLWAL